MEEEIYGLILEHMLGGGGWICGSFLQKEESWQAPFSLLSFSLTSQTLIGASSDTLHLPC